MAKYAALFIAATDTVVGIGAPVSAANLALINELKGSAPTKPLVIMVSSIEMALAHYATRGFDQAALELARQFWPGPTTLACNEALALRMPDQPLLLALIAKLGPVYMTSANKSGEAPLSLAAAQRVFNEVSTIYDFGLGSNKPSRIIDVRTKKVLRA